MEGKSGGSSRPKSGVPGRREALDRSRSRSPRSANSVSRRHDEFSAVAPPSNEFLSRRRNVRRSSMSTGSSGRSRSSSGGRSKGSRHGALKPPGRRSSASPAPGPRAQRGDVARGWRSGRSRSPSRDGRSNSGGYSPQPVLGRAYSRLSPRRSTSRESFNGSTSRERRHWHSERGRRSSDSNEVRRRLRTGDEFCRGSAAPPSRDHEAATAPRGWREYASKSVPMRPVSAATQGAPPHHSRGSSYEKPINVVIISNAPTTMSEQEVEAAVRLAAIGLGFSPPNLVKRVVAPPGRTVVVPGASRKAQQLDPLDAGNLFVEFPSIDAAQLFYEGCRDSFRLRSQRVQLEMARPYIGHTASLTPGDAELEWVCIMCQNINASGCPMCIKCRTSRLTNCPVLAPDSSSTSKTESLGPMIPCPDLGELTMDRKSGLLKHPESGLFFDPQSQQFISPTGVFYMRATSAKPLLVPVQRVSTSFMTAPSDTHPALQHHITAATLHLTATDSSSDGAPGQLAASEINAGMSTPTFTSIDPSESTNSGEQRSGPVDSAQTKASTIASVLAAAQEAAKATKRVKVAVSTTRQMGTSSSASAPSSSAPTHTPKSDPKEPLAQPGLLSSRDAVSQEPHIGSIPLHLPTPAPPVDDSSKASSTMARQMRIRSMFGDSLVDDYYDDEGDAEDFKALDCLASGGGSREALHRPDGQDSSDDAGPGPARKGSGTKLTNRTIAAAAGSSTSSSTVAGSPGNSAGSAPAVQDNKEYICFICIRQFLSAVDLLTHQRMSAFHKRNLELQCTDSSLLK